LAAKRENAPLAERVFRKSDAEGRIREGAVRAFI
jgi:hypothetical protein